MVGKPEKRLWVQFHLKSREDVSDIQNMEDIELFGSSLRIISDKNVLIDGYIPMQVYESMKREYNIRILGEVGKKIKGASQYVSKTNRYRKV